MNVVENIESASRMHVLAHEIEKHRNANGGERPKLRMGKTLIQQMEKQTVAKNYYSPGYLETGAVGMLLGCDVFVGPELPNNGVEIFSKL